MNIKTEQQGKYGANCYMVSTDNAALLIDVFTVSDAVRAFIEESRTKQMLILATHRHFDHIAGMYEARALSGAEIAVHEFDACGFESTADSLGDMFGITHTLFTADKLLHDGDVLHVGDITVKVVHTPGHTVGSVCFIVENAIFSGDTLFRLGTGKAEFPTGNATQLKNSLKKLFEIDGDYTVYPGHDSPTTLYYEKSYNPYCQEL